MLHLILLVTTLHYTIPLYSVSGCDSLITDAPERIATVEIMYAPRYSGGFRLLRAKPVGGRAGEPDTIQVPDDTLATIYLAAVDSAGNRSCEGNPYTVAARIGVPAAQFSQLDPDVLWYDVVGRRLDGVPRKSGVYWRIANGRLRTITIR